MKFSVHLLPRPTFTHAAATPVPDHRHRQGSKSINKPSSASLLSKTLHQISIPFPRHQTHIHREKYMPRHTHFQSHSLSQLFLATLGSFQGGPFDDLGPVLGRNQFRGRAAGVICFNPQWSRSEKTKSPARSTNLQRQISLDRIPAFEP